MTHIVFIQRAFPLGGIETLTLRLANRMADEGHRVTITGSEGEMSRQLSRSVNFVPVADHRDLVRRLPKLLIEQPDEKTVLVSLHPMSLGVAAAIAGPLRAAGRDVASFHLVSHSRAFFFGANWPGKRALLRRYFRSAPPASTYFMNDAARAAHESHWKEALADYPVLRLALIDGQPNWHRASSGRCDIVSVGRLVPFKGYNLEAPGIVRAMRDRGIDARWTIWGFGECEEEIRRRIAAHGVDGHVVLRGALPYVDMLNEVSGHDVFVGMGTAVLEAAAAGVPSICAVENHADKSYGFLSETPLDSVGDVVAGIPMNALANDLGRFASMSAAQREEISRACIRSVGDRSATLDEMIAAILDAQPWRPRTRDVMAGRLGILLEDWKERLLDPVLRRIRQ
jgi:glycosyltransferase involved in cell wall biosynthesis